ncbi:CheY-like chemotaxis protein [Paucibacter oligotrophus]|uniref:CheY-like chemotaxis protein n=1 Tax=Roseateles oligotrophus TaxID=1769250 RepID=A0A840L561_9BURK|nr:response regulator [Roseateles oligotrophus]MBB4843684.1 CheY-like chemotaxis protein [Roseateles oligotrophus]
MTPASEAPAKPVILLVDDAPENLFLISSLLKDSYRVKAATSGSRALEILGNSPEVGLILLDVMMPVMDGYQVLQAIKSNPLTRDIPVIFLTALGEGSDTAHGLGLGASDYLSKPVDAPLLLQRVGQHLPAQPGGR